MIQEQRIIKMMPSGKIDYKGSIKEVLTQFPSLTSKEIGTIMFYGTSELGKVEYVREVIGKMVKDGSIIRDGAQYSLQRTGFSIPAEKENSQSQTQKEEADYGKLENDADIKYDEAGNIDWVDTIIAFVSKNPGASQKQLKDAIFGGNYAILKMIAFENTLGAMSREGDNQFLIKNGDFYYIFADAVRHDMNVTEDVMNTLEGQGISNAKANFLASGVVMKMEQAQAEAKGENYDPNYDTQAAAPGKIYEDKKEEESNEETATDELAPVKDPFEGLSVEESEKLKKQIAAEFQEEKDAKDREAYTAKISSIKSAEDLIGMKVEINPGGFDGQVTGTVLQMRPTGLSFLVVFSNDTDVEAGTILTYEYAEGIKYKLIG